MSEPAAYGAVSDAAQEPAAQGVGASVRRNEDRRLLDGGGAYLADLQVPGLAEIAFLRSPVAHGRIRAVEVPPRHRGSVFFAADIAFAKPIVAVGASAGFKYSEYPALASDKVRFVGDLIGDLRRTHARRGGRHRAVLLHRLRGIAGDLGYRRRARRRRDSHP